MLRLWQLLQCRIHSVNYGQMGELETWGCGRKTRRTFYHLQVHCDTIPGANISGDRGHLATYVEMRE